MKVFNISHNVTFVPILVNQPVLLQEYADFLVNKQKIDPEQAYVQAQR